MKNYSVSLDIVRIISAFFVVFSHTTDIFVLFTTLKGGFSWELVYYMNTLSRIAVPLFVILSGYLVLNSEKTKDLKKFYKRRFSRVLLPLLVWVPIYFWWAMYWGHVKLTSQFIIHTIWTGDFWHLYFLVIIMELYLIAPFLSRLTQKAREKQTLIFWGLIAFSIFCATLVILPGHIDLRRNIITMFIPYVGFFYAGAYLRSVKVTKKMTILFAAAYFILGIITNVIANGDTNAYIVYNYSPTLLFMSLAFFLALKNIDQFLSKKILSKIIKPVALIAPATFGIYLIHYAVLDFIRQELSLYPWQLHSPIVFFAILPAIITFFICLGVVLVARKISYLRYILG